MEFQTLKNMEPEVEKIGEEPVIEIEIRPNEAMIDTFRELFNEAREKAQEEKSESIEEKQKIDQEEVNAIWSQIGPRIP